MRGKVADFLHRACEFRITPAYAGKSVNGFTVYLNRQDHPRLCGEKFQCSSSLFQFQGSPPPMRGKGPTALQKSFDFGITPAYAGKSKPANFFCTSQ